jgi:hypothetical protein
MFAHHGQAITLLRNAIYHELRLPPPATATAHPAGAGPRHRPGPADRVRGALRGVTGVGRPRHRRATAVPRRHLRRGPGTHAAPRRRRRRGRPRLGRTGGGRVARPSVPVDGGGAALGGGHDGSSSHRPRRGHTGAPRRSSRRVPRRVRAGGHRDADAALAGSAIHSCAVRGVPLDGLRRVDISAGPASTTVRIPASTAHTAQQHCLAGSRSPRSRSPVAPRRTGNRSRGN